MSLMKSKSRCWQDWFLLEALGEKSLLPASRRCWLFLASGHIPPISVSFLVSPSHSLYRPLWLHWTHLHSPESSLHLKIFDVITSTKFLLPCKVSFHKFWGLRHGHSWWGRGRVLFSPTHSPPSHGQEEMPPVAWELCVSISPPSEDACSVFGQEPRSGIRDWTVHLKLPVAGNRLHLVRNMTLFEARCLTCVENMMG